MVLSAGVHGRKGKSGAASGLGCRGARSRGAGWRAAAARKHAAAAGISWPPAACR